MTFYSGVHDEHFILRIYATIIEINPPGGRVVPSVSSGFRGISSKARKLDILVYDVAICEKNEICVRCPCGTFQLTTNLKKTIKIIGRSAIYISSAVCRRKMFHIISCILRNQCIRSKETVFMDSLLTNVSRDAWLTCPM